MHEKNVMQKLILIIIIKKCKIEVSSLVIFN